MVKFDWFRGYVPGEHPAKFDMIIQSWDTANKSTELSDFSVCTTWGRKYKKLYRLLAFASDESWLMLLLLLFPPASIRAPTSLFRCSSDDGGPVGYATF